VTRSSTRPMNCPWGLNSPAPATLGASRPMATQTMSRSFPISASPQPAPHPRESQGQDCGTKRFGRRIIPVSSACAASMRVRRPPHLLQIVEGADFRTEDMNDHVARIDQYPIAMGHALDPSIAQTRLREILEDAIGDSAYMALRPAGGHNHAVRNSGFQGE